MSDQKPDLQTLHETPAGAYTRLTKPPSEALAQYEFVPDWTTQKPAFPDHLLVNMAWVVMLAEQGLIKRGDAGAILGVLRDMERAGSDEFPFNPKRGELYFNLESYVIDQVGPAIGGQLYFARSRIDGEPTAKRLFMRRRLMDLAEALVGLVETCLYLAGQHLETVMPGYTGSQAAQPWTFGHYLLAFADAFGRDFERLQGAYPRLNQSLLGMGVGAGSDFPLDRTRPAELLGFEGFVENVREPGTAVDAFAETVAVCSILLAHLGQLAHDLHTWCTREFGMVELGDEFSGSSSFMPQKKNPLPLHKIRAVASGSSGFMPSVLSVMRTSSQDFDLTSPVLLGAVINALHQAHDATAYMSAAIATLQVHAALMRDRALRYWTCSSEVASLIVRERDVAWRTAHRITERFVRLALDEGKQPTEVTAEMLDRAALEVGGAALGLSDEAVRRALDPLEFIRNRRTVGSASPTESARMLADRKLAWADRRQWCEARRADQAAARKRLDEAMDAIVRRDA